jgi:hypothetical protein
VKIEAQRYLYRLGYSNEMLYDVLVGNDDVALTETKFTCQQRFDKTPFYKIIAEYQVDSLYFDRDKLALKIEAIYNALFRKYGTNARIWTFYFYDENDIGATKNWICRGVWREKTQYAIEWTKTYYAYRLNHLNEQISRRESIERHSALIKQIEPLYNQIYTLISIENFEIATFFALISSMQREVAGIGSKANDIPFSDEQTELIVHKMGGFISNVDWFVGDMMIYSKRTDLNEKTIRWMIDRIYIEKCQLSQKECSNVLEELKALGEIY